MLAIFNTPVLQYLHRVLPSLCHSSTLISGQVRDLFDRWTMKTSMVRIFFPPSSFAVKSTLYANRAPNTSTSTVHLHIARSARIRPSDLIQGALALYSKGKWKIWVRTVRILPKLSRRSLSLDHTALLHDMRRIVILSIEREQILDVDASTIYLYICFKTKMSACTLVLTMSNLTSRTSII